MADTTHTLTTADGRVLLTDLRVDTSLPHLVVSYAIFGVGLGMAPGGDMLAGLVHESPEMHHPTLLHGASLSKGNADSVKKNASPVPGRNGRC